jgi:sigma-B regulation protein RsbU (phosphoserine phosphatase)
MTLRTQLVLAFLLLSVVPLSGVTVYTYISSQRAFRQAVAAEAGALAEDMTSRLDAVAHELAGRIERMRERSRETRSSAYEKARRDALATAEHAELSSLLLAVLSGTQRQPGGIPFALDADGKLYAPEPADLSTLQGLGLTLNAGSDPPVAFGGHGDWVVVARREAESGVTLGVARPVGESLREIRRTAVRNLGYGLGMVSLALLGILPLSRRMTRHLDSLTEGAERMARGDLEVEVPVPSGKEFARLAQTFNRMARDLRTHQEHLLQEERLHKELEMCRRIQEELLPRGALRFPFAEAKGVSVPAREVGGDFFNYFGVGEGEAALLVGDVSGKGLPAALLMANLQATLRARLPLEGDLARLAARLDDEMAASAPASAYLTLFIAVLDGHGVLRYVNAGHNTQFGLRREGRVEGLESTGRPLGLLPGGGYEERRLALATGDGLFLFTDGLVEAENARGEAFGTQRLEALLLEERASDLGRLLARVDEALRTHRGGVEAADDATMVVMRVGGAAPSA